MTIKDDVKVEPKAEPKIDVKIEMLGGFCPVQAEGTVNGVPFYFRARGAGWAMHIGGNDLIMHPDWFYREEYGVWPEAGWMSLDEAQQFIHQAAAQYLSEDRSPDRTPPSQ